MQQLPNMLSHKPLFSEFRQTLVDVTHAAEQGEPIDAKQVQHLKDNLHFIPKKVLSRHGLSHQQLSHLFRQLDPLAQQGSGLRQDDYNNLLADLGDTQLKSQEQILKKLQAELKRVYSARFERSNPQVAEGYIHQLQRSGVLSDVAATDMLNHLQTWHEEAESRIRAGRHRHKAAKISFYTMLLERPDYTINTPNLALALGIPWGQVQPSDRIGDNELTLQELLTQADNLGLLDDKRLIAGCQRTHLSLHITEAVARNCGINPADLVSPDLFCPALVGVPDNQPIPPHLATEMFARNAHSIEHLAQALGLSKNVAEDALRENYHSMERCWSYVLHEAQPLTLSKLAKAMTHPAIMDFRALNRLQSSQKGQLISESIPSLESYGILDELSLDERQELADLMGIGELYRVKAQGRTMRERVYILREALDHAERLTPPLLLRGLETLDATRALKVFHELYPECQRSENIVPLPSWQPDIECWNKGDPETRLNQKQINGLPPTADWRALGYLLGMSTRSLERISDEHRDEATCSLIMLQKLHTNNTTTTGQLATACRQLHCLDLLRFLPEDIQSRLQHHAQQQITSGMPNDGSEHSLFSQLLIKKPERWQELGKLAGVHETNLEKIATKSRGSNRTAMLKVIGRIQRSASNVPWDKVKNLMDAPDAP
ncbi:MAG: death domain-containing protein [Endozoicomonas sp.]